VRPSCGRGVAPGRPCDSGETALRRAAGTGCPAYRLDRRVDMSFFSRALVVVAISASPAIAAAQPSAEPVPLRLPMGSRVRVQMASAPGSWTKGILASADSSNVALIPDDAAPLGDNRFRLPTQSVTRLELKTGAKRHWLPGLLAGAALGALLGATAEIDPNTCDSYYTSTFCSRGEAYAAGILVMGGIGAGVGALIKTDRWTPVALDALGPPAPRVSGVAPRLRALPRAGVGLEFAVGF